MRLLRSFFARMMLSHIVVATLSGLFAMLVMLIVVQTSGPLLESVYPRIVAHNVSSWLLSDPDGLPNPPDIGIPEGFTLIVSPDNKVVFSQGDTPCRAGILLADCAPEVLNMESGTRFTELKGQRWNEIVQPLSNGHHIISIRGPAQVEMTLTFGTFNINGNLPVIASAMLAFALLSLPLSFCLSLIWARPTAQRIKKIADANRTFASGDLSLRILDKRQDELGLLAYQFNEMADAIQQNLSVLRELAARNAELGQRAEASAVQAERLRLSRDLHDAIAQRLFSLSVSTANLPEVILNDQSKGAEQARVISTLAEQTLLDLRALLLQLRPTTLIEKGLAEALTVLASEWQTAHHILAECSIFLSGRYLPASVEDVIYRVTQESFSNVAKHAHAGQVQLSLVEGQRQITLSVTDDGQGFDPDSTSASGKLGLLSMRERTGAIGGSLHIESDTAHGTTIRLTLPLEQMQGNN